LCGTGLESDCQHIVNLQSSYTVFMSATKYVPAYTTEIVRSFHDPIKKDQTRPEYGLLRCDSVQSATQTRLGWTCCLHLQERGVKENFWTLVDTSHCDTTHRMEVQPPSINISPFTNV